MSRREIVGSMLDTPSRAPHRPGLGLSTGTPTRDMSISVAKSTPHHPFDDGLSGNLKDSDTLNLPHQSIRRVWGRPNLSSTQCQLVREKPAE